MPLPLLARSATPFFAAGIRGFETIGDRALAGAAPVFTTGVKYSLLRACSSSAALRDAGLHTHVRTHRTSSDPAYLHTYVYLYMKEKKKNVAISGIRA